MKRVTTALLLSLVVAGCGDKDPVDTSDTEDTSPTDDSEPVETDNDGDGSSVEDGDCDDNDPSVFPGQEEECNGADDNCNGVADEGFGDVDGDGIANCLDPEDCDGVDNDGDGEVDEGFGDVDSNGVADCVDVERCDGLDNDGDGSIDEDFDNDSDGYIACADDCDDNDAGVNPGATEALGDGIDNDCDGLYDEDTFRAGDLVITELMINPAQVADPEGEWIEVLNNSGRDFSINGLVLRDSNGEEHQILSSTLMVLAPGERAVLGSNADHSTNGDVDVTYQWSGIRLGNAEDNITIVAAGTILDTVIWDDGAFMPDPEGASISLDGAHEDAFSNDVAANWCAATTRWTTSPVGDRGTPGQPNGYCN